MRARQRHHVAALWSPGTPAVGVLPASAPREGRGGVKSATEVSEGMERLPMERAESQGLLVRGRERQPGSSGVRRLCPTATLGQTREQPPRHRSLIALMWLCSCQCSGEAKMTMTSSPLRTCRSHRPRPCSPWRKPRSVSTSAPGCWCPSTGRNWGWPSAHLCLSPLPRGVFLSSEQDHSWNWDTSSVPD